jgi:hypothetical protein
MPRLIKVATPRKESGGDEDGLMKKDREKEILKD